jgi:hypothetical protein
MRATMMRPLKINEEKVVVQALLERILKTIAIVGFAIKKVKLFVVKPVPEFST